MKTFKNFLNEMARRMNGSYPVLDDKESRQMYYNEAKNPIHVSYPDPKNKKIELQSHMGRDEETNNQMTVYHTNDHAKKETIHLSEIYRKPPTKQLPFEHEEQSAVHKYSGGGLPKGYATDITYKHFKESKYPLKSSDLQYEGGHKMWQKMSHKAMDEGHHVYYHNGKELIKSTPETLDKHLNDYYGKYPENTKKHMIISKTELGEE